jgi:hypothetical protein
VFGQAFWLDAALPLDRDYSRQLVVVTDVRFTNEAQRVRDVGGHVWRIERPGAGLAGAAGAHPSEAMLLADRVVINDGTLDQLRLRLLSAWRCSAARVA